MKTRHPNEVYADKCERARIKGLPIPERKERKGLKRGAGLHQKQVEARKTLGSSIPKVGKRGERLTPGDRKASKECKRLAFETCAMHGPDCGGKLDPHHVIKRRHEAVRYDQRNLVCLCRVHHDWAEINEQAFIAWFEKNLRPGVYRKLEILAFHDGREAVE